MFKNYKVLLIAVYLMFIKIIETRLILKFPFIVLCIKSDISSLRMQWFNVVWLSSFMGQQWETNAVMHDLKLAVWRKQITWGDVTVGFVRIEWVARFIGNRGL